MALSGPVFAQLLTGEFTSQGFTGSKLSDLCTGIGNGVANYLLTAAIYQGTGVGVGTGIGTGTGTVTGIVGALVISDILAMMTTVGFTGTKILSFATAIGNAFASFIALGIISSTCTGMAVGTGTGKLIVLGPVMSSNILTSFTASGFTGTKTPELSNAIGNGICNNITTFGIVTTAIIGVGYPPTPSTGLDVGTIS